VNMALLLAILQWDGRSVKVSRPEEEGTITKSNLGTHHEARTISERLRMTSRRQEQVIKLV
jgi:hypothetical protein